MTENTGSEMDRARACLEEIVELHKSSPESDGAELLERVVDLFFVTTDKQSAQDRDAFGEVMERMAYAADPATRAKLAERMATAELAPVELMRRLARDEIYIARPILQYSPSLREGDLVAITRKAEQDHLKATAHRNNLTSPVTDIIVKRGDLEVLQAITSNTGAEFSSDGLDQLSRAAEIHSDLQTILKRRRELAPRVIAKLKRLTDGNFWQNMAETMLMTSEDIDNKAASKSKKMNAKSKNQASGSKQNQSDKPQDDEKAKPAVKVSESVLVEYARASEVDKTLDAFASFAELDKTMAEHCLFQAHISALMVLCKAHGLAPGAFTALLQIRETVTGEPTEDVIGLMRRYESMTAETAKRIISFSEKRPGANKSSNAQASA